MTGIGSNTVIKLDLDEAAELAIEVNKLIAREIGIKPAARITCIKPAGTTSCVLGTSSGIHAWHDNYYIRRIRIGKNEALYNYIKTDFPSLIEDAYERPHDTAVISLPQKAPKGAITRHESALNLLDRVRRVSESWITSGHIEGMNTHNVSATISIKEDEWDAVAKWMWVNREYYNGLSVLPYDGGSYKQAGVVPAFFFSTIKASIAAAF